MMFCPFALYPCEENTPRIPVTSVPDVAYESSRHGGDVDGRRT